MRYYTFLSLAGAALILDVLLFGLGLAQSQDGSRLGGPPAVLAAPNQPQHTPRPIPTSTPPTRAQHPATQPSPTPPPVPTATPTPTPPPLPTATPTPEPAPQII